MNGHDGPFWLSPWPFLEPRYTQPLPPADGED